MRRRMLTAVLSCCLCLSLIPAAPAQDRSTPDQANLARLEQRLKELEEKVARLEREVAAARGGRPGPLAGASSSSFPGIGRGTSSGPGGARSTMVGPGP